MKLSDSLILWLRLSSFLVIISLGIAALVALDFDIAKLFAESKEVEGWVFVLAMSLLPVAGFPIAAFYLFAGLAYGFWEGWAYCLVSLAINMSLSFAVARHCIKEPLTVFLQKRGYEMPQLSEINAFRFTFLLRTIPGPPFPVQNYLLSLIGIPFSMYLIVSLLTQGTIAAGMVACGGVLPEEIKLGHVLIAMTLLAFLVGGKCYMSYRKKKV